MADPASPVTHDYLDYARTVLPLVAVGLGWWLRGYETRAGGLGTQLDEIVDELENLLTAGSSYWRRDTTGLAQDELDLSLEAEIQGRMHTVHELCESIVTDFRSENASMIRSLVSELRQTLTGRDFASTKGHSSSGQSISRSFSLSSQIRVRLRIGIKNRKWRLL